MFIRLFTGSLVLLVLIARASACLRPEADERAVQWSTIVVKATYASSTAPSSEKGAPLAARTSDWTITDVYDGPATVGQIVHIVTFIPTDPDAAAPPCAMLPDKGKPAVLLLRAVKDCTFDQRKDIAQDAKDAYVMVARLDEADATADAVKDLQARIAAVRKGQAAFNPQDAKLQAQTLANAQDDVEADHAESTLLDLGPQAVSSINEVIATSDARGKSRLHRVVADLSPPPADTERPADAP